MVTVESADYLQSKLDFFNTNFSDLNHPLIKSVQRLIIISEYAGKQVKQLQVLLSEDNCTYALIKDDYQQRILSIPLDLSTQLFGRVIREARNKYFLRLLLRELAELSNTEETMSSWSVCADVLIAHTLTYCERQLESKHGAPVSKSGQRAYLYALAMGKLGGMELNYSSDIDLIFFYTEDGYTNGIDSISNHQFYSKVVQLFTHLFHTNTADGFVFRVDLRLRPNGESGPLVCSLAMMETYYQEQGRDWERYAMVKARLISEAGESFYAIMDSLIRPFVYRRYIDFSVIESLRSMKALIEREIQLNPMLDDIKRGRGGIREVEFIIQSFQLIRGGRLTRLQQQNALKGLDALGQEQLLTHTTALKQAYLFLRKLENALQSHNDQQTHSLPSNLITQQQLSLAMDFPSWDDLIKKLDQYRRIVSHAFHAVLNKSMSYEDTSRVLNHQLENLWQGQVEETLATHLLKSLGYQHAERCYQMLYAFKHSPRCRRLNQAARLRLDRFMVLLLIELSYIKDVHTDKKTDEILLQIIRLLENIVGRSAYLALLTENPQALQELLHWFIYSPFITSLIVNQPFLLEVLVDQEQNWQPLTRLKLKKLLQAQLINSGELEMEAEVFRQFKLTCWLLAARAELHHQIDAVRISKFLADVAEVIIGEVVNRACTQLSDRYPEITRIKSNFAVVAYGKLGGREMSYDSDLDLVFLHTASVNEEGLVTRLTQKILHMLTTRSQAGILYPVDTRLRPSGSAGLLVSHLDSFIHYQLNQAWTWEHQALIRGRVVFGNQKIKVIFNQLKRDVLYLPRDISVLKKDIQSMREKMMLHQKNESIKHNQGGLIDLEFLVQFLVLAYPSKTIMHCTNTRVLLKKLFMSNVLTKKHYLILEQAYTRYHTLMHLNLLTAQEPACEKELRGVKSVVDYFYNFPIQ